MKSKVLYKESRQLPPPSKDYVSLELSEEKLTLHRFRISPANLKMNGSSGIKTDVVTVSDFLDGDLQDIVLCYFGKPVLDHLRQLARGELDHLERLSDSLKIRVMSKLPIESLKSLSMVSQSFRKLCDSDAFWRSKFSQPREEIVHLGEQLGFKNLFFMSKIDVQRHLRKVRQSQTFITEYS